MDKVRLNILKNIKNKQIFNFLDLELYVNFVQVQEKPKDKTSFSFHVTVFYCTKKEKWIISYFPYRKGQYGYSISPKMFAENVRHFEGKAFTAFAALDLYINRLCFKYDMCTNHSTKKLDTVNILPLIPSCSNKNELDCTVPI